MTETCLTCRNGFDLNDEFMFECRRYAPRPVLDVEDGEDTTAWQWPKMFASEWCGEFEQRIGPLRKAALTHGDLLAEIATTQAAVDAERAAMLEITAAPLPCPFCGGTDIEDGRDDYSRVACQTCYGLGPFESEYPVAEWNSRADISSVVTPDGQPRPCPFCGTRNVNISAEDDTATCETCGGFGPTGSLLGKGPLEAWNTRSADPVVESAPPVNGQPRPPLDTCGHERTTP